MNKTNRFPEFGDVIFSLKTFIASINPTISPAVTESPSWTNGGEVGLGAS